MYQKVIVVGNLGRDPEMRYMPDGTAVTNFSVATTRRWTNKGSGEAVEETTWFRINVWGRQAETANQYLSRGRKVLVEGTMVPDRATGGPKTFTRQDGTVGSSFEIRADTVKFLSGRQDGDGYVPTDGGGGEAASGGASYEEDDIPF